MAHVSEGSCVGNDESFGMGDDEVMMLREVDWGVVAGHPTYEGTSDLLQLLGDVKGYLRVGERRGESWTIWVRQEGRTPPVAEVLQVETTLPTRLIDADGGMDAPWILEKLKYEPEPNRYILWTVVKHWFPNLAAVQEATTAVPTVPATTTTTTTPEAGVGSWECSCSHCNVGFKAKCEVCGKHAPAGWWKQDAASSSTPKLPSLEGVGMAIPRLAPHRNLSVSWDKTGRVGWSLRNDDLVVVGVEGGGCAEKGGLLPGMRIVSIDNKVVTSVQDVGDALQTAPFTFELTVSTEPTPQLKATTTLTETDGVVATVLTKQPHDRMGTHWASSTTLVLTGVDPGTPADLAGLTSLVGWRLTHVNTRLVTTAEDIIQESAGQSVLPLYWARPTPGPAIPFPKVQVDGKQPQQQQQQQQPVVSTFAPSLLWVIAPKQVQHCGGLYRIVEGESQHGMPYWKHAVNDLYLYSSRKGLWCVSDSVSTVHGWIFSTLPSSLGMPDTISEWEALGQTDPSIKVVSTLPIPGLLKIDAGRTDGEHLRGTYTLIRDTEDSTLPFKVTNGMPAWKSVDKDRWVYSSPKGLWVVTDDPKDFPTGGGIMFSTEGHGGIMPYEITAWNKEGLGVKSEFKVSIGGGSDEEDESPKANMTATVHENAVWGYEDIGTFSLAKYLQTTNQNYENLLWVSGSDPHKGWLGIDLSNEEERGQLVRILTELVDQESIHVRQPVVAGVAVCAALKIKTLEGYIIEPGTTGQVISVSMSRTPVGNSPPRMAKVNFNGTTTVTVSYGQVWPVQSTFERCTKVRVLAVDAVAVVDSETVSNGVGVRGKYRVKYATGKTYHVRNFALINADKPWGEGDEASAGSAEFKEGTKVELATNMVFSGIESLPKGTVGVVTNFGQEVEVLAGGVLLKAFPEQLKVVRPQLSRGDLVSPALHSGTKQDSWDGGRVQEIDDGGYTIQTADGTVRAKDIKGLHFATGQGVQCKTGTTEEWQQGTIISVLRDGTPLISVGDKMPRKYWFVRHVWEAAPTDVPCVTQLEAYSEVDDTDPLVSMKEYLSMDPGMLREAENMRRRWIEGQRLKEAVHCKLSQMAKTAELRRAEAGKCTVVLRKGTAERMGTDFFSQNSLLLTSVAEGSAAQKCGLPRFIGRILCAVDGAEVQTTDHVKIAAGGKSVMTLEFEQSPLCGCGSSTVIRLTDRNRPGMCPGCLKAYGDAHFFCRDCFQDVCGQCGQEHRGEVVGQGQASEAASAAATSVMQQQMMNYQMMQQQMYPVPPVMQQQQQQQPAVPVPVPPPAASRSWGQDVLAEEVQTDETTSGRGWGVAQMEIERHEIVFTQPQEEEEEEEPHTDFNLTSMIDSVISKSHEDENEDVLGLNLSSLLSKVSGLSASPPTSPPKHNQGGAQQVEAGYFDAAPWAAIEKKSY